MLINLKWNITKLCTLYRKFESFITVIFLPAVFNYLECSSDISSDSLPHSEFEASPSVASLLPSCSQSSELDKQHFKNDFLIILSGTFFQASEIHSTITDADVLFILPLGVKACLS
jgi:hypothetical protein